MVAFHGISLFQCPIRSHLIRCFTHTVENMEQEYVAGVYQSLGMTAGQEFSSEDMSLLYHKICHVSSTTDEAHMAMRRIAGDNGSWSCVGETIFDVLLEMQKERERKEQLFWDLQLLNAGNPNKLNGWMDEQLDIHLLNELEQSNNTLKEKHTSDTGFLQPVMPGTVSSQETLVGDHELNGNMRRLKKAATRCWIRLASEGVQSILPLDPVPKVKGQAWGRLSLSDVFLLVDVKYDVAAHLLHTEMLQEHHTKNVWGNLLPDQKQMEEEALEHHADEALESGDMLCLAELPGAFRTYRACAGAEFREQSWSAASILYDIHKSRQMERNSLTNLGGRLDRESLRLVCLYIRLATLRALREKVSYTALLAAKQSWDTWPHVTCAGGEERAAVWLQTENNQQTREVLSRSPQQQAVLQLLVLTQDQEMRQLVELVHGVSPEELHGLNCIVAPKEDSHTQTSLRKSCVKRLRLIRASLQTHTQAETHFEQTNSDPLLQPPALRPANVCSGAVAWSQHQKQVCAVRLLTHLQELHDVQASALLRVLVDESEEHLQGLRDEYESELQSQDNTNMLQLLSFDASRYSDAVFRPESSTGRENRPSVGTGEIQARRNGCEPSDTERVSNKETDRESSGVHAAADGTNTVDICADHGAVMEEIPYLEILCVPDTMGEIQQSPTADGGAWDEGGNTIGSPQTYEKQGSLITLAWSRPADDEEEYDVEAAGELSPDSENREGNSGDRGQVDQLHGEGAAPERDLQTHVMLLETQQVVQPNTPTDPPELKPHCDDPCSGVITDTAEVGRAEADEETCLAAAASELWDVRSRELSRIEDQEYHSQATFECTERETMEGSVPTEKALVSEPISAMERELTIRSLVDMQRKVELRQLRDKERQMLRVQERLSIIQSRKAEEDLLGLKVTDRLRHLTQDLPQEDKNQQKTVVIERLEQLRRECSYVLQTKRDRNTAGFKELLSPVAFQRETEDEGH